MGCYRTKASYFAEALAKLNNLNDLQRSVIDERYVRLLESYEGRCKRLSFIFHVARILMTVGSLVVPALLSIQYTNTGTSTSTYSDPNSFSYRIYWATWVLSLLVTTSNGIVSVFKIDKKYYFIHTTYEQLRSEGWQYLGLTGRYSSATQVSTHENQFIYFCHVVEKIKMKQVEEEYYKLNENNDTIKQTQGQTQAQTQAQIDAQGQRKSNIDIILPISPLKPLEEQVKNVQPDLMKQLLSLGFKSKETIDNGSSLQTVQTTVSVPTDLSGNTIE